MNKIKYCANEKMAIDILEFIKRGYDKNFNDGGKPKYIEALGVSIEALEMSIEALEMSIEALEKRIPKKPILDRYGFYHCPCCGDDDSIICGSHCCCDCGQALDWSEE